MNISVPDDLAAEVRAAGLPVSAVCQRALREELARLAGDGPEPLEALLRRVIREELAAGPGPLEAGGVRIPVAVSDRQPPGMVTLVSAGRNADGEPRVSAASAVNVAPGPARRSAHAANCKCGVCKAASR